MFINCHWHHSSVTIPSILVKSQAPKKHKVQATRAHFGIFLVTAWSYRALQKNSTSISQGKIDEQCWEFKGKLTIQV